MTRDEAIKALGDAIQWHITVMHNSSATNPHGAGIIADSRDRVRAALRAFADAIREDVLNTEIATWPAVNRSTPDAPHAP